jgi:heme/copper-type cytochrome/quinol oxidase subunit 2
MTLLSWMLLVVGVLSFLYVVFDYRLKHIDKDGRTVEHKRTRRVVLWIAIISIMAQKGADEIRDRGRTKTEGELRRKVDILNTNVGNLGCVHK